MLIKKSGEPIYFWPGLPEHLVGLALTLYWVFPTGHNSQIAVGSAFHGRDFNALHSITISQDEPQSDSKSKPVQPTEIGTSYRRTKNGWEDSSKWQIRSEPIRQQIDAIHPATWSLIVIGLGLLVLFGCSNQSEIDRLFSDLDRFLKQEKRDP